MSTLLASPKGVRVGHKTGLPNAGAQGKIVPLDRTGVDDAFAEGAQLELSRLAREHTDAAIQTLVKVMRSTKAPANAKVSAATRLLEFAHGKAAQSVNHNGSQAGGLTINILRMTDGGQKEKVLDAVSCAKELLEG